MKPKPALALATTLSAWLLCACATTSPPKPEDYRLAAPQAQAERTYLGLPPEGATFHLEEIRCEVLVIDCFDMYCHVCQAGAVHVNELYRRAQERGLGARVKFVGLGAGDTPMEVATYKEKFKVPFPLFPDRHSTILKQFGELKLPNLIILRSRGGKLEVMHRSPGPLTEPDKVLSHIESQLSQVESHHWEDAAHPVPQTCESGATACRIPGAKPNSRLQTKTATP